MKLGEDTGSVVNAVLANAVQPIPQVGMGATIFAWTDRYAGTVISVDTEKRLIVVREDQYRRTDRNGLSEVQQYEFTPSPEGQGREWTFRLNRTAGVERWREKRPGQRRSGGGHGLMLGRREKYVDPSH